MYQLGDPHHPRLVTIRTGRDHTDRLISWAVRRVVELESEDLCLYLRQRLYLNPHPVELQLRNHV